MTYWLLTYRIKSTNFFDEILVRTSMRWLTRKDVALAVEELNGKEYAAEFNMLCITELSLRHANQWKEDAQSVGIVEYPDGNFMELHR